MAEETGAIVVRKEVMDKFHNIMAETRLEANELMEHFFGLYHCCVKLVQPFQRDQTNANPGMVTVKNELPENQTAEHQLPVDGEAENDGDVAFIGCSVDQAKQDQSKQIQTADTTSSSTNTSVGTVNASGLLSSLTSLTNQSTMPDPVLAFQSLLALYRRDDMNSGRRKNVPKRILPSNYNPTPCDTKPEDVLKKVMCSLCQATFDRFTDLLAHHKNTHNSDMSHPLRCRACGRTQTSEAGLVHHQIYVCKMVERPFTCEVCTLKFQSEEMVWVHKCSGDTRKRFACEFCDHYKTESASDLEKHMRIHTGDKCFRCETCGFQTAWKKNLKEHMLKHSGLKPYVCDFCGYSTADKHNLRAHRLKHGKEEGFDCAVCGLTFNCYRSLRLHKDTHNNMQKPFKCSMCDYRAKYKSVLHLHEVRHNHMRKSACDLCGQLFSHYKELVDHRIQTHPEAVNNDINGDKTVVSAAAAAAAAVFSSPTTSATSASAGGTSGGVGEKGLTVTTLTDISQSQPPVTPAPHQTATGTQTNTLPLPPSTPNPQQQQQVQLQQQQQQQASIQPQPPPSTPQLQPPSTPQLQPPSTPHLQPPTTPQLQPPSTPQLQDASMLPQQQQQVWKGPMLTRVDSLTQTCGGQGLMVPSSLAGFQVQQAPISQNVTMQSFGAGVLSPWPGGMGTNVHDFFGARVALGQNPNESLLRQTAALSQAQTLPHPSTFVACPLPVFPGLGEQLPGGGTR